MAINEAQGWKERTTVEDMDLAVRVSLSGWKFLYVGDIKVFILLYISTRKGYERIETFSLGGWLSFHILDPGRS